MSARLAGRVGPPYTARFIDRSVDDSESARMSDAPPLVLARTQGGVRTLALNRPQALNSFNGALHDALMAALRAAAADATVRCLVLTGSGRGFCAGQDLADPEIAPSLDSPPRDIGNLIEARYKPLALTIAEFPVPVIAAVNGVAAGAGANLALNCDIVVAARSASFLQAFAKIGLIPDAGGTWLLPRLVGRARAMGLALLADKLAAEEAERIGLIWRCVDDDRLAGEVQAMGERLAAMPVQALAEARRAFAAADRMSLADALSMEGQAQRRLGAAHDYREGVAAFFEKRAPKFTDR
jgi:2-(1,2-epoxy-1,2-dihydrophenyl)acetyl-CoA isomerase